MYCDFVREVVTGVTSQLLALSSVHLGHGVSTFPGVGYHCHEKTAGDLIKNPKCQLGHFPGKIEIA